MPEELILYITKYGYLAIFSLVFLQEIGIPNPVPNELILLFSGYLSSIDVLSFPLILITVVSADFIGTTILYSVFYFFGPYVLEHKPKWIPLSHERIQKLGDKIEKHNKWGIYLGRLIPYARGYISIAAGLLEIKPKIFLTAVFVSALTWSGGYALAGKLLGPYWQAVADKIGGIQGIFYFVAIAIILVFLGKHLGHREKQNN